MSQLVIKDLDFYESENLNNEEIRGSASFFDVKFDFSSLFKIANLSGQAGAAFGVAIGLAIGDKIKIELGTGVQ